MENKLKPFDKILVRDDNAFEWQPEIFHKTNEKGKYCTLGNVEWNQCIPYKGNEHLMDTANMPEITDLEHNILFGIELKVGYVLKFENCDLGGVIIPTTDGLAVAYFKGSWDYLKSINIDNITEIRGMIDDHSALKGKLLWSR